MKRPVIKICGITRLADLRLATRLGADWIGYNFYRPSPRCLTENAAKTLIGQVPDTTTAVGLFVNADLADIERIAAHCALEIVQLHGDESPAFCRQVRQLGLPVMKAFRIRRPGDIPRALDYPVDYYLLDAFHESGYGGTGHRFDWDWIGRETAGRKVLLAGGIDPDTITEALAIGLYGIDLCSGVEQAPGVKDPQKMRRLFDRIDAYVRQGG